MAVPYTSDIDVPVPYMRWINGSAIVVAANRHRYREARLTMQIPLMPLGQSPSGKYVVRDLWNEGKPETYTKEQLAHFDCTVRRDKTPRGD